MFFLMPPAGAATWVGLVPRRGRPPRPPRVADVAEERLSLRISSRDWFSLPDMFRWVMEWRKVVVKSRQIDSVDRVASFKCDWRSECDLMRESRSAKKILRSMEILTVELMAP